MDAVGRGADGRFDQFYRVRETVLGVQDSGGKKDVEMGAGRRRGCVTFRVTGICFPRRSGKKAIGVP